MYVLGITNGETASACLMKDGEVVAAASEERFTRVKMDGSFPSQSIQYCLDFAGIALEGLDAVAYSWAKGLTPEILKKYLTRAIELQHDEEALQIFHDRIEWEASQDVHRKGEFHKWAEENLPSKKTKVFDFFHHEAHAASAAFYSPFTKGFVFTADGRGDYESSAIWRFDRLAEVPLTKIYSAPSTDSFGYFYGRITGLLGFKPMRHEGKITGLAAYGNPVEAQSLCEKMISVCDGRVIAVPALFWTLR